jgi:hypothetical protein
LLYSYASKDLMAAKPFVPHPEVRHVKSAPPSISYIYL